MGTTAEKLTYLSETKASIKNAIAAKGVNVPDGATFRQYANLISGISTGLSDADLALADATPEDVTAGKTFYAGDRTLKTGMASKGLVLKQIFTGSISASQTFTVESDTFMLFGSAGPYFNLFVYYLKGEQIFKSNSDNYLTLSVSTTTSGYNITVGKGPSGFTLSFGSSEFGNLPIYIFEG